MRGTSVVGLALLLSVLAGGPVGARDWFVRAGAEGGDGSRERPFADPWQALERCEAGDAVHVTAGEYFGRLDVGAWVIPFDRVQLVGGYDASFTARDPWKHGTRLVWKRGKNRPTDARITSSGRDVVLDGLILDSRLQNNYTDERCTGRQDLIGQVSIRLDQPSTVRNCVILNTGRGALRVLPGSTIENNLFLNTLDAAVEVTRGSGEIERLVARIHRNTIVFGWDPDAPGEGGSNGSGIALSGHADVRANIIAYCDNNAIDARLPKLEKTSIRDNVFFMNLWSVLKTSTNGIPVAVDAKTMDLLEELGLKDCSGNRIEDPGLRLDPAWIDLYSQRTARQPGKVEMDDWNELRRTLGLPLIGIAGDPPTNLAPAYDLTRALELLATKAGEVGARVVPLQVVYGASGPSAAPARTYEPSDFTTWLQAAAPMEGKSLELVVGIGNVTNVQGIPATYDPKQHAAVALFDHRGKGQRLLGFYRKGTHVERLLEPQMGRYSGQGVPDRLFRVRGVAHAIGGVQKVAFFIEELARCDAPAGASRPRPKGRDWFVRAGASGGDGTRDKPFKDPFQALERCESGDVIHVAEGEYVGKLKTGRWQIDCPWVALVGGYDAEFKQRDPWKRPTRLVCPADFKGSRGGITLEGAEDHTGFVLDGFVFDKRLNNTYRANGDLDKDTSDKTEHLRLVRPECVVRNCVFVNGAGAAMKIANGMVVENNIVLNHMTFAVEITGGLTPSPLVFGQNTVAFCWDIRFGQGHGANGNLLRLTGRVQALITGNVFEFADNDAIDLECDPADIAIEDNVFAHNLWSNVSGRGKAVDDATHDQLADLGLRAWAGNQLLVPGLPVDQQWFDTYLGRTAYVPGKVKMDDWNKLREIMGQPLVATGGKLPEGFAPAYEWQRALELFPANPACKAGARPIPLEVKLDGVVRQEPTHAYEDVAWEVTKDSRAWDAMDGKRVALRVAVLPQDNNYLLPELEPDYQLYKAMSPAGTDGLPIYLYLPRGSRHERAARLGVTDPRSTPETTFIVRGIARPRRCLVVESVEKE